ncbi:MAG TPA: acyl-CoA dehydrogenase family protein [Burkholderiaceae bacterium]|nr:acyl-CoA dehydrogenase family protein [Burkholderiaceae bacterium]
MEFALTEEQTMLQASVRRFVDKAYTFAARGESLREHGGFDRRHWTTMAGMGWLGVALDDDVGGSGGSAIEQAIVLEELGRGLVVEPVLAVAVLAAHAIARGASARQRQAWLPLLAEGAQRFVLAHGEPEARGRIAWVQTRASPTRGGWSLRGQKTLVLGGPCADRFIVSARVAGQAGDEAGIELFCVDPAAPGMRRRDYRLIDDRLASDLVIDDVVVDRDARLAGENGAFVALDRAYGEAIIGACAEAVGTMECALWLTRDYLTTRKQFGVSIGSFQTLQHRMADLVVALEQARAMVHRGLAFLDHPDPSQRRCAVAATKAQVGWSGKFIGAQGIQLHGGIGMSDECSIGHYFKRLAAFDVSFGGAHDHLATLALGYGSHAVLGEESRDESSTATGSPVASFAARATT